MRQVWLFDIDGTLIVSGGAGQDAAVAALEDVFQIPATRVGIEFAGRTDRAIIYDLFAAHGLEFNETQWELYRTAYLRHLQRFLQERKGSVLAGVADLLARLKTRPETHLGLITGNMQAAAELKLQRYGLWDNFDFGGYGDLHFSRNDVAHSALLDARRFVTEPFDAEQVWVVGDTVHDIVCARAIGARVIAVTTGNYAASELQAYEPDLLLTDLAALPGHIL